MSKVLIVDDDKDISELISLILKNESIESIIINDPVNVIKDIENKHYLAFAADTLASNGLGLYWSIYFLKDI